MTEHIQCSRNQETFCLSQSVAFVEVGLVIGIVGIKKGQKSFQRQLILRDKKLNKHQVRVETKCLSVGKIKEMTITKDTTFQ